jgi:hypothetical protein
VPLHVFVSALFLSSFLTTEPHTRAFCWKVLDSRGDTSVRHDLLLKSFWVYFTLRLLSVSKFKILDCVLSSCFYVATNSYSIFTSHGEERNHKISQGKWERNTRKAADVYCASICVCYENWISAVGEWAFKADWDISSSSHLCSHQRGSWLFRVTEERFRK